MLKPFLQNYEYPIYRSYITFPIFPHPNVWNFSTGFGGAMCYELILSDRFYAIPALRHMSRHTTIFLQLFSRFWNAIFFLKLSLWCGLYLHPLYPELFLPLSMVEVFFLVLGTLFPFSSLAHFLSIPKTSAFTLIKKHLSLRACLKQKKE